MDVKIENDCDMEREEYFAVVFGVANGIERIYINNPYLTITIRDSDSKCIHSRTLESLQHKGDYT